MTHTRRRHIQKRRTIRRKNKRVGGGCGCDNQKSMWGGSNMVPSPGLDQLPIRSYYELNPSHSSSNDPISPDAIQSTRIQPNIIAGGKRRRHRKSSSRRRRRKSTKRLMRGGGFLDSYSLLGNDAISNFGTTPGIFNSNDLLRGNFGTNPNPSIQPITTIFNSGNPQLV